MITEHKNRQYVDTLQTTFPMIFNMCEDVESVRNFYSGILGLKETAYEKNSYVDYFSGGVTMIFYEKSKIHKRLLPSRKNKQEPVCWNIKIPRDNFYHLYEKLKKKKIKTLSNKPLCFEGVCSLPVIDPVGNKVEIYYVS